MGCTTEIATALQAFVTEIDGTGWTAQLGRLSSSSAVSLRLELRSEHGRERPMTIDICRRTFAEAAKSARKHLRKQVERVA